MALPNLRRISLVHGNHYKSLQVATMIINCSAKIVHLRPNDPI